MKAPAEDGTNTVAAPAVQVTFATTRVSKLTYPRETKS